MKKTILLITFFLLSFVSLNAQNGSGTSSDPYLVSSASELYNIMTHSSYWSSYIKLTNHIDMSGYSNCPPIGRIDSIPFTGNFNGNGFVVYNCTVTNTSATGNNYLGFFGYTSGAVIKNFRLKNISVTGQTTSGENRLGGLIGHATNTELERCGIISGSITGLGPSNICEYIGGLIGFAQYTGGLRTVFECFANATVSSASNVNDAASGGLIGRTSEYIIDNCYSGGSVSFLNATTSTYRAGGIIGFGYGASINRSYSKTNIFAPSGVFASSAAGIAGMIDLMGIFNSFALNTYVNGGFSGWGFTWRIAHTNSGGLSNNFGSNSLYKNGLIWYHEPWATGRDGADIDINNASNYAATSHYFTDNTWDASTWLIADGIFPKLPNVPEDTTRPRLIGYESSPTEGSLILSFSQNVYIGVNSFKNIKIYKSSNHQLVYSGTSNSIDRYQNNIYVSPEVGALQSNTSYYMLIADTSIYNGTANAFPGVFDSTVIKFTTGYLRLGVSVDIPTVNSATSMTLLGTIVGSNDSITYHFEYGTNKDSLNQSTPLQSIVIPISGSIDVSEVLTGLTPEMVYYFKLVAGGDESDIITFFLSTTIPMENLRLRCRADLNLSSTKSPVAVDNWGDVSGFGNDAFQLTIANQPTLINSSINGKPAVHFNGSSSYLTCSMDNLNILGRPYEIFVVAKSSSPNIQFLFGGSSNEQFEYHLNGLGARFIPVTSVYLDKGVNGEFTDGNPHVFSGYASQTGGAVRVDGINGGTSSSNITSFNSGYLRFGMRCDNSFALDGDIAEIIIYDTVLSSANRTTVEQYLANRYGITSGALPVELSSFSANYYNGKVLLNWKTETEVNNFGFEIEKTVNNGNLNLNWQKIGFVNGAGNSNSRKDYSFSDNNISKGNYFYRLKQLDSDGKFTYSKQIEININEIPKAFELYQNYPNPFNPSTRIKYAVSDKQNICIKLYNILGKELITLVNELKEPGYYEIEFDASKLAAGVYFYSLKAGNFLTVKKMIISK